MTGRLEDRVALVTGAGCIGPGWGNGRSTCVRFAQEGARLFAVDIDEDAMAETLERLGSVGAEVQTHLCDVTDNAAVGEMVQACIKHYGRVDVLVNNVGGSVKGNAAELDPRSWQEQMDYNLGSVYNTCHHVLPQMVTQKSGNIVNTASGAGVRWTGASQAAYASSKAGVIQFSRVTAVEYAPHGIRVNTIIPGQLHTPMVEARLAGQRAGGDAEQLLKDRVARIPLGFMGDGRDTANAALFLASDEARFITGTELVVDGGMTVRCD